MIKWIIIALIAIIVLSYFGYDIKAIINAPTTQSNLSYTFSGVTYVWDNYLSAPVTYIYKNIFLGILWQAFLNNLGRINSGAPTELENAGQRMANIGNQGYQPLGQNP